jgi:hypothetical protein
MYCRFHALSPFALFMADNIPFANNIFAEKVSKSNQVGEY